MPVIHLKRFFTIVVTLTLSLNFLPQVMAIDERLRSDLRAGIARPERQQLGSILSRLETNLRDAAVINDADRAL